MIAAAIARNEIHRLFLSPFAWATLATVQFLLSVFFYLLLTNYLQAQDASRALGLTAFVVIGLFQVAGLLLLFVVPLVSMRVFSDELRTGTISLLFSSPVSLSEIVFGKFVGMMVFLVYCYSRSRLCLFHWGSERIWITEIF